MAAVTVYCWLLLLLLLLYLSCCCYCCCSCCSVVVATVIATVAVFVWLLLFCCCVVVTTRLCKSIVLSLLLFLHTNHSYCFFDVASNPLYGCLCANFSGLPYSGVSMQQIHYNGASSNTLTYGPPYCQQCMPIVDGNTMPCLCIGCVYTCQQHATLNKLVDGLP